MTKDPDRNIKPGENRYPVYQMKVLADWAERQPIKQAEKVE